MLHTNFTAVRVIEAELLPIEVLHCENRNFQRFWSCDLDLDPMTFIYKLDLYSLSMYRISESEFVASRLSKVIVRQTDRHNRKYIPHHFAGGHSWKPIPTTMSLKYSHSNSVTCLRRWHLISTPVVHLLSRSHCLELYRWDVWGRLEDMKGFSLIQFKIDL